MMLQKFEEKFVEVITFNIASKNPIIIGGFPGMGLVGNIVSQYLIEQLSMEQVGRVDSRLFPPIAILYGGIVKGPVRIYESSEHEVIVIFSDIPIDPLISREVGRTIVDWIKTVNPKEVVSIAGLATNTDEHKVYCAATDPEKLKAIQEGLQIFEIGTISGVPGVLINECLNHEIPAICLLGETRGPNPDPRAAIEVVQAINKIYGLNIDITSLKEQADEIEQVLHKLSQQLGEAEAKPRDSMYG